MATAKGETVEVKGKMIELAKGFANRYANKPRHYRTMVHQNTPAEQTVYMREKQQICRQESEFLNQVEGLKGLLEPKFVELEDGRVMGLEERAWFDQRVQWVIQALKEVFWYGAKEVAAFRVGRAPNQTIGTVLQQWMQPTIEEVEELIASRQGGKKGKKEQLTIQIDWAMKRNLIAISTAPAPQQAYAAALIRHQNAFVAARPQHQLAIPVQQPAQINDDCPLPALSYDSVGQPGSERSELGTPELYPMAFLVAQLKAFEKEKEEWTFDPDWNIEDKFAKINAEAMQQNNYQIAPNQHPASNFHGPAPHQYVNMAALQYQLPSN